jgi:hypothetical protein
MGADGVERGAAAGYKKGRQRKTACRKNGRDGSDVGLGLAETLDAVAGLPLATLLEDIHALKALQDIAFDDEAGGALEAFVLRHGGESGGWDV